VTEPPVGDARSTVLGRTGTLLRGNSFERRMRGT